MYALPKIGQPKNIVILRALPLKDLLNSVPAFRALRRACPDSRITLDIRRLNTVQRLQACLVVSHATEISQIASAVRTRSVILSATPNSARGLSRSRDLNEIIENAGSHSASQVLIRAIKQLEKSRAPAEG